MHSANNERLHVLKAKRTRLQDEVDAVERRGGVHPSGDGVAREDDITQQVSNIQKAEISELTHKIDQIEGEDSQGKHGEAG